MCKSGTSLEIISSSAAIKRMRTWRAGHILHTQYQSSARCPFMNMAAIHTAHKRFTLNSCDDTIINQKPANPLLPFGVAWAEQATRKGLLAGHVRQNMTTSSFIPTIKLQLQLHSKCRTPLSQCFKLWSLASTKAQQKALQTTRYLSLRLKEDREEFTSQSGCTCRNRSGTMYCQVSTVQRESTV